MKTIRIIIEDDGNDQDQTNKVVFGFTAEDAKEIVIMPLILSTLASMEHHMKLADKCIKLNYPHLNEFSSEGQDRILKEFNAKATLYNIQYPGSFNPLKIVT